jgi:hypothetical protein
MTSAGQWNNESDQRVTYRLEEVQESLGGRTAQINKLLVLSIVRDYDSQLST